MTRMTWTDAVPGGNTPRGVRGWWASRTIEDRCACVLAVLGGACALLAGAVVGMVTYDLAWAWLVVLVVALVVMASAGELWDLFR